MTKKCPKCNRLLNESEFNWKIKNKIRASYCQDCSRQYIRNHYKNNKKYYLEKARKRNILTRIKINEYIREYFKSHSCIDCGETDILVLEFDHKDRNNKVSEINKMIRQRTSLKKVVEEISKCNVRCANCHRRKTQIENNSWRLKYAPVT